MPKRYHPILLAIGIPLLVAAFWLGLGSTANLLAQQPELPVKPPQGADDGEDDFDPQRDGFEGLRFPDEGEARDARLRFEAVKDYLREQKNPPWDRVCDTAQFLLNAKSDYFYRPINANEDEPYVSIKDQTNKIIGTFPKEGREFYQLTYGPMADAMLKEARESGWDRARLADISQRFFHTKAGGEATLLLASLNLETGHYSESAYAFDRLINRPHSEELLTPRTLLKAAMAFRRADDAKHEKSAQKVWDELEKQFPRDGLQIGRKSYTLADLRQEFARPVESLFGTIGDDLVAMRLGNASRTGMAVGGTPFLDPSFHVPMYYRTEGNGGDGAEWVEQAIEQIYRRLDRSKGQVAIPGFFPVTTPNLLIFRSYDAVYAIVSKDGFVSRGHTYRAGEIFWVSPAKAGVQTLMGADSEYNSAQGTLQSWWQQWIASMPTILFENSQVGSLSHDGKMVYAIDDIGLPPPPQFTNINQGVVIRNQQSNPYASLRGLPEYSRLLAIDIETGKLRWQLGSPPPIDRGEIDEYTTNLHKLTEGAVFLGPPLPVGDKSYILLERDQQIWLACINPANIGQMPDAKGKAMATPELLWVQRLGSPNLQVSQDTLRRIQPTHLAYSEGVLVCPTNSGAVIAIDVNARSLLWARGYNSTNPAAQQATQPGVVRGAIVRGRAPSQANSPLPSDRWRASAPIITGGKVIMTAHDSKQILCLDLRTGNEIWQDARKSDDLYVGGIVDNKVVVVGKESVRAYDLAGTPDGSPAVAWQNLRIGTPAGHGVVSRDGLYYVPMIGDPDNKDSMQPQVWAIDVATGKAKSKTAFRRVSDDPRLDPRTSLGNLLFHDGQLFSQTATGITAFPLIELKRQEMDKLLAKNPKDPVGLTARGELLLDEGKITEAVADFKLAEQHEPPDTVRRKIRQKLYIAYTELLRKDFDAAEPLLDEYETLCEVAIDTDDPIEKQRLMDEQIRRRGLFLSLVAKGREAQGNLPEAFKYYRAFAALGDNKQLVSIYDEPNTMTRPDVWARGRIDAMIRNAKDDSVRKPLQDRVTQDWHEVRDANDLPRLREFVKVFGPYFNEGREAQLHLADRLLQTNNEDDSREAQVLLMQLWATATDKQTQAQAVDSLAKVFTRRGMLEDAVGLYTELGTKYADVKVRDGKTGSEIFSDLITDKRLLPYLEPIQSNTTGKYKVEQQSGQSSPPFRQQNFTVNPTGELLPFFRRHQLSMELNPNNGSWTLKVTDRINGEERAKFPDLNFLQGRIGQNQAAAFRMAHASGHTLLMNIGQYVYCFDLIENRELWRYDLFKRSPLPPNVQPQIQQEKDELVVSYPDGWTLRLGRSSVLEPNYSCLITRDGLVALDPSTGQELWQRTNVSTKSQVFGDANNVFLVETTNKGNRSLVLRAVDGSVVDNVPNFADLFTSSDRVNVIGRKILLNQEKDDKRVLRLYDPLNGKDDWAKEFPAKSELFQTFDPELTGFIMPDGRFEVLATTTGESVFAGRTDADRIEDHLNNGDKFAVSKPILLADNERFYLFLNREQDQNAQRARVMYNQNSMIRSEPVNGVAYAFDRATGKRLWFTERLFENQALILERFEELPVLIAAAQVMQPGNRSYEYRVAVLDKQLGKLRYLKGHPQNGTFVSMFTDPKTRAVVLWRYDMRLQIIPDTDDLASR